MRWFRMYAEAVDDEKLRLLAFEDRWHFVAICCLKCSGILDSKDKSMLDRKVSVKLGLRGHEVDEVKRRLYEVGLINKLWQPTNWNKRQYLSDNVTERVRKHRMKRSVNVSETPPDTDTDTDTDTDNPKKGYCTEPQAASAPNFIRLVLNDKSLYPVTEAQVEKWSELYPALDVHQELRKMCAWLDANPANRKTKRGILKFITNWLSRSQDRARPVAGATNGKTGKLSAFDRIAETGNDAEREARSQIRACRSEPFAD